MLEKILEEMQSVKEIMLSPTNKDCFGEPCKENDCCACAVNKCMEIVSKHMNYGWTPVGDERLLGEIKRIKDGNRKEKLYAKYPPDSKNQEVLNAYSQGYEDGTDNFYNAIVGTIRKRMNDSWVPVEEQRGKNTQ